MAWVAEIPARRRVPCRRRVIPAIIVILVCVVHTSFHAEEAYPWHTLTLDTHVSGLFLLGLSADTYLGGGFAGGFSFRTSALPGARIGIEGGYGFQQTDADSTRSEIPIRLIGGYAFSPGGIISIAPLAGIELAVQLGSGAAPRVSFIGAGRLEFHLFNRNKVFLEPGFRITFSRTPEPRFGLTLGLVKSIPFMLPLREMEGAVSMSPLRISPDGDGYQDTFTIRTTMAHPRSIRRWKLSIYDEFDSLFYSQAGEGPPPEEFVWDGLSNWGELVTQAGEYRVELYLIDKLNRVEFYAEKIVVDILLRKEGDRYLIQIPYITFPPDSADFSLLTDEAAIAKNREVLERLAEIFNRFPEYSILVEGHANIEFYEDPDKSEEEQKKVLLPLSEKRAGAVKDALVGLGIAENRLSVTGVGGARPIVPFSDTENRWKNRRVEFILIRNGGIDGDLSTKP